MTSSSLVILALCCGLTGVVVGMTLMWAAESDEEGP